MSAVNRDRNRSRPSTSVNVRVGNMAGSTAHDLPSVSCPLLSSTPLTPVSNSIGNTAMAQTNPRPEWRTIDKHRLRFSSNDLQNCEITDLGNNLRYLTTQTLQWQLESNTSFLDHNEVIVAIANRSRRCLISAFIPGFEEGQVDGGGVGHIPVRLGRDDFYWEAGSGMEVSTLIFGARLQLSMA